ncbi:hypothetical protein POM88_051988 [Heracleum sosnowskyi]|uniref:Trichome birefringence-like N-terminal domain-containing protein n=1 Tax=Heracleum sosnowskyi TaxID=360622 RepID=A0AAD8GT82_9APIA|nr:hypothetical protein POM88_051988 [Heracleum sosnowskyi]
MMTRSLKRKQLEDVEVHIRKHVEEKKKKKKQSIPEEEEEMQSFIRVGDAVDLSQILFTQERDYLIKYKDNKLVKHKHLAVLAIFNGITCTYQNAKDTFYLPQKNLNPEFNDQLGFFTPNITIVESPKVKNQTQNDNMHYKDGVLKSNITKIKATESQAKVKNQAQGKDLRPSPKEQNKTENEDKKAAEGVATKKQGKEPLAGSPEKSKTEKMMEQLMKCDFFDGEWVKDDSYPLYKPGSCTLIDEQFNCFLNGRPDQEFQQYKWKPKGCILTRTPNKAQAPLKHPHFPDQSLPSGTLILKSRKLNNKITSCR